MVSADPSDFDTVRFQAALLDSVGEAVIATDVGGIVLYWNRAAARLYGWTAQEAVGQPIFELTPAPEYVEEATAIFAELTAGRSWSGEFVVRHRDGHAFPVHVTDTPVFGADGTLQAIIGISTDITERRRVDLAARHLSAIVESSNDAIISEALDGTILSWNSGAERLFGYAATEVTGQHIRILAHNHATEEEITDLYRRVTLGERVQGLETVRRHKDGSLIDVSLTLSPVYDDDGSMSGFAAILRDDSARREVERALKHHSDLLASRLAKEAEASERLRELDRIKDDLVATVSHELRTPLASILGYIELLKDEEADPLTLQQGKWVDAMDRNGDRLLALVDNLLTVSTIDAGTLPSSSSPVDLRDVISSARRALQPNIDARRLITRFHLPALPIIVRGDAGQLEQVVCNLLGNAVKFTEDGGTVECAVDIEDSKARLTVSDDGIGIPENEQPGLFTRFFRSTTATERAIAGTGLGLNIAYSIVRSHGGDISVVSAPGRGTRVMVDLPTLAQSLER
ncbi:MAG: PAS domain S-box protein [Nocardioides sp.]|nr:PAS domain S-box protein [Nocardioides sp.]